MKTVVETIFILLCVFSGYSSADNVISVRTVETTISDHLDLNAVASLFSQCKDLEDFEKRLNNPDIGISNLDLNNDGQVDYLRVVETVKEQAHRITLQAVIGHNQFQDVATITLEKNSEGNVTVKIIGATDIYGDNYTIDSVDAPPLFPLVFWAAHYRPWRSTSNWDNYPGHYRPWSPFPLDIYRSHIQMNNNNKNTKTEILISPHAQGNHRVLGTQQLKTPNSGTSLSTQPATSNTGKASQQNPRDKVLTTRPRN